MREKVKKEQQNGIVECNGGILHFWRVRDYSKRLAGGEAKRTIEQSEIRLKLAALGYKTPLAYRVSGQPYLEGSEGLFLSISHSGDCMVVYISDHPVGVDIERKRTSIFDGRSYFVNAQEEQGELTTSRLHLIWGAKEAIYKKYEGNMEDLKNDVTIHTIDSERQLIEVHYQGEIEWVHFRIWDGLFLVFTA